MQITETMSLAADFLINCTHTHARAPSLSRRMREGGAEGEKMPGGLSNADHLSFSLPATAPKPLPPISWTVAMETTSAQELERQGFTKET